MTPEGGVRHVRSFERNQRQVVPSPLLVPLCREQPAATPRADRLHAQTGMPVHPVEDTPLELRSPTPVVVGQIACLRPGDGLCVPEVPSFPKLPTRVTATAQMPADCPEDPAPEAVPAPIVPDPSVRSEALPRVVGDQVDYYSASFGCWIPAFITRVDETGAIELDVKRNCLFNCDEQREKVRPRTRPTTAHLEWLRSLLREGRIEEQARSIFRTHARTVMVRDAREQAISESSLPTVCAELDEKLGVSGCLCQFQRQIKRNRGKVFSQDGFTSEFWVLLMGVDREYGEALTSTNCEQRSCVPIEDVYEFQKKLEQAPPESVGLWRSKHTDAWRAIKQVKKPQQGTNRDTFEQEIEHLRLLDHPHIVKLHEHYEDIDKIYLVMDYCSGGGLDAVVDAHRSRREYMETALIACVMEQVLKAIAHVHVRGLVHMNLKSTKIVLTGAKGTRAPANDDVFVQQRSNLPHVMVTDVGVAQLSYPEDFLNQSPVGTPATMAPEVWSGELTPAGDIFSLGVVLFNMLTYRIPFGCTCSRSNAPLYWSTKPRVNWSLAENYSSRDLKLCKEMLHLERCHRPTATSCLASTFLMEHGESSRPEISLAKVALLKRRMAEIADRSLLYQSVAWAIARVWPANQDPTIKYLYGVLDINNTGQLDKDTVIECLEMEGIEHSQAKEAVDAMKLNRGDRIDWTEFVSACLCLSDPSLEKDLRLIFDAADKDHDGFLLHDDVAGLLAADHLSGAVVQDVMIDLTGSESGARVDWESFRRHFGLPSQPQAHVM